MQQLHLVVQTLLTGFVLLLLVFVFLHGGAHGQPSIVLGPQKKAAHESTVIPPKPAESLVVPTAPYISGLNTMAV